ncbi:MAG: hypothetical protein IPK44_26250 [Candidatus Accumulibacter sp.]|uniref:hypothetical protein n=1 Tax=Accumulibacter sp. TaxID=2053492 RepID=UPI0025829FAE|nr:hypothetical protein [Accumulibacter sp.]MBK8117789.1 hypothetical protein [Accumulibacter sp.]
MSKLIAVIKISLTPVAAAHRLDMCSNARQRRLAKPEQISSPRLSDPPRRLAAQRERHEPDHLSLRPDHCLHRHRALVFARKRKARFERDARIPFEEDKD